MKTSGNSKGSQCILRTSLEYMSSEKFLDLLTFAYFKNKRLSECAPRLLCASWQRLAGQSGPLWRCCAHPLEYPCVLHPSVFKFLSHHDTVFFDLPYLLTCAPPLQHSPIVNLIQFHYLSPEQLQTKPFPSNSLSSLLPD